MQPPEPVLSDLSRELRYVDGAVNGSESRPWPSGFLQEVLRDAPSFPLHSDSLPRVPSRSANSAATGSEDMDWTPQGTPHTSPRFLRPLLSQSSHALARAYRNPPSRRLGQTSSQPPMDETIKQATNTLTLDLDIDNDGYLPRAFDPLSAVFDPDQVVDGFPRTRCPELPSSSEFPLFLLDATSDYQAPGATLVSNYGADDPLSWLDLEALIQATYNDDAQTDSDASWLTEMLLGNDSPSSASLSNPAQISHEEASSFPEPTGMLDDFVKDLQAALLEPANPTHLASENHDIMCPDDQSVREPNIDLDWWREWVNEDYAPATPFPGFEPPGSSAALYEVKFTHYPHFE